MQAKIFEPTPPGARKVMEFVSMHVCVIVVYIYATLVDHLDIMKYSSAKMQCDMGS